MTIHDLQSRNGVFVNGSPVTERALADGDRIGIGDSALVVVIPATGIDVASNTGITIDDTAVIVSTVSMEAARTTPISRGPRPGALRPRRSWGCCFA